MSSDGIFSSRMFNMSGLELDEKGKVIPKGQIFNGADFVLKNSVLESDKIGDYMLIIQSVRNGEPTIKQSPIQKLAPFLALLNMLMSVY